MRKTTRKTSKKTSKVFSRKPVTKSTSKKVSTKKITPIKKTTVPKVNPSKNTSKKISRKTSKKINNTKKSTSKKSTVKKTTTTTTRKRSTTKRTTTKRKSPATTTTTTEHLFVFVPVALPTNNPIDEWEEPVINIIEYTSTTDEIIPTPSPSITDHNDPVTVQNVAQGKDVDAEPQSKVVGVSIGAVVGCLAAAGLAGMFIYKRHQRNVHDKDVEDLNETSEVNTRWRTQSFMAVVAGAVSKLPNRSNSSSSQRSIGIGVMGSLRRAATNASRSLSRSGSSATQQSYGIATSAPAPPIARIDVDDYYSSNNTPHNQHNHVY
ncbi:hypothetical protein BDB01DRAFT_772688 [Pilobolus umbonatus]|nr:hypothetical protein BDB01DRAFT_772688 [Pilobolus umbonatus]